VARREHRWRRRTVGALAVLVVAPLLGVAILWPLTPGVAQAGQLIRAHLAALHSPELVALPVPDRVGQALIATEDSRFFQTPGVDPISAVRAGLATVTGSGDTGGATLEQQLAKNLYFRANDGVPSKVLEAELALQLDASYSKSDILRMYLAEVYFGHGYYGLPAAARGYFGVAPARLSWAQASMLAVIGLVFGVPLGIALGRVLWRAVAGFTPLAYHPPLALLALLLVGPVALLAANALAAWPQHRAARLHSAHVLRSE